MGPGMLPGCFYCPRGRYSDHTGASACERCSAGHTTALEGAQDHQDCIPCKPGSYGPEHSFMTELAYDPLSSGCYDCEPGRYASVSGLTACIDCPQGYGSGMAADSASACAPCSSEHYYARPGLLAGLSAHQSLYDKVGCVQCPFGRVANISVSNHTECSVACPEGHTTQASITGCISCPLGTTVLPLTEDNPTMYDSSHVMSGCSVCPGGRYPVRRVGENGPTCADCPRGRWSSVGVVPRPHGYVMSKLQTVIFHDIHHIKSERHCQQAVGDIAPERGWNFSM